MPFLESLKAVGYATDTIEITPARMNEEVEKVAKSKFDREQRQRKPEDREVFDLSKIDLPKADEGKMYYGGWLISGFPTVKRVLEAGLILKVLCADFAHMKRKAKGNIAFVVGFDADHRVIVFGAMHTIFAESFDSWNDLLEPVKVVESFFVSPVACALP